MIRRIESDGYALACESEGSGLRIVWVDPALGSSAMRPMEDAIHALAERFEVVTYDRRGRGRNTVTTDMSAAREVDDLAAVVAGMGEVHAVVGFSSGAGLVLHAAARLEVPLLVLVEPAVDEAADESGLREQVQSAVEAGDDEAAVLAFYESIGVPDEIVRGLAESQAWPAVVRAAPTLLADIGLAHVSDEVLARVRPPVHLIVSDGSPDEITHMSDRLADRLSATVWREAGGWHGVDGRALADRLDALLHTDADADADA